MASVCLEVARSPAVPSCALLQSSVAVTDLFWGLLAQQKAVRGFAKKGACSRCSCPYVSFQDAFSMHCMLLQIKEQTR